MTMAPGTMQCNAACEPIPSQTPLARWDWKARSTTIATSFYYGAWILIHLELLLECPSPSPLLIMSLQQKMWNDRKNETISIISLRRYNKTCKTTDDSKSEFRSIIVSKYCVVYDDLWTLKLSYLNQLGWKSLSLEFY
jgi:hypothetical protein